MNHADCDHYWEKGWVVVEGIYDVDNNLIPCEPKETLDSSALPLETSTDKSVVGFQGI